VSLADKPLTLGAPPDSPPLSAPKGGSPGPGRRLLDLDGERNGDLVVKAPVGSIPIAASAMGWASQVSRLLMGSVADVRPVWLDVDWRHQSQRQLPEKNTRSSRAPLHLTNAVLGDALETTRPCLNSAQNQRDAMSSRLLNSAEPLARQRRSYTAPDIYRSCHRNRPPRNFLGRAGRLKCPESERCGSRGCSFVWQTFALFEIARHPSARFGQLPAVHICRLFRRHHRAQGPC